MPVSKILRPPFMIAREAYLLRDDFNDTLAAGAVNGMPATPGPGTRVVQDTDSVVSVGSGAFTTAAGTTVFAANVYYAALTRVPGILLVARQNAPVGGRAKFGFAILQSGRATDVFCSFNGGALVVLPAGASSAELTVGATSYFDGMFAVVLRAAGGFSFARNNSGVWKLVWVNSTVATATVYPCITVDRVAQKNDFIRMPVSRWSPIPLASDSFNRANGALGTTDGAGHAEANGGAGLAWTSQLGTWGINTNTAMSSVLDGSGISIATVPCGTPDVCTEVTATRVGNEVGKSLRYVDANNYLLVQHDGANCQLVERVGGVNTVRITAAAAIGAGALICILNGASARLYLNALLIGTYAALVNTTATAHGVFTTNTDNALNNFVVWATGSEGQYSVFNRWTA